ncbi:CPBP family intramembrane glutamic endopeptidase [Brachybacterium sp. GCM10030267]|uniref:CPBP family intramembrane glutamic endopeptidase n=1 Tax=unclassified Brachybacterium TaxID=2623841 RepID=UPI0036142A20
MSWWKPLVIVVAAVVLMVGTSFVLGIAAMIAEVLLFDRDPENLQMTPLMLLATNASLVIMAVPTLILTAWLSRTPWRRLLQADGRVRFGRGGLYLVIFGALVLVATAVMSLVDPSTAGVGGFAVSGTTIALIAAVVLTTPLQAAAEEITFRGAIMPAVASWIRPARAAVVVGLAGSSLVFGTVHLSADPWLFAYYTLFGASMAAMAVISRGLEAPIAFHVANNVVMMLLAALFADGGGFTIDRSVGMGGPFMLFFIAVDVLAVVIVWLMERRARRERRTLES